MSSTSTYGSIDGAEDHRMLFALEQANTVRSSPQVTSNRSWNTPFFSRHHHHGSAKYSWYPAHSGNDSDSPIDAAWRTCRSRACLGVALFGLFVLLAVAFYYMGQFLAEETQQVHSAGMLGLEAVAQQGAGDVATTESHHVRAQPVGIYATVLRFVLRQSLLCCTDGYESAPSPSRLVVGSVCSPGCNLSGNLLLDTFISASAFHLLPLLPYVLYSDRS